jgi:photosystem II stability/assembly factor-like uncharacterized protein
MEATMQAIGGRVLGFRAVLALGLAAAAAAARGGVGHWTSSGPAGTEVYALAASFSTPSKVFALSAEGFLRSTDGGVTWANVNPHAQNWYALTVSGSSSLSLYALTQTGLVRSDDEGVTWVPSHLAGGERPYSLAVDPSSGSTLYAGTFTGVFRSSDGGLTWSATEGIPERYIEALAVDPSNPSIVYASGDDYYVRPGEIYKSTDGGRHWTLARALGYAVPCLVIDPMHVLYGCSPTGVIKSIDGGTTWTPAGLGGWVYSVVIDPLTRRVYASTEGGFFRRNGDTSWTLLHSGPSAVEPLRAAAVAIVPSSPTALLVAARGGILRSTDAAASWTFVDAGGRASIQSVAVDPSAPGSVYAGGEGGVFRSGNAGASWTPADLASPVAYALAAPALPATTVIAGGIGISSSTDGGARWEPRDAGVAPSPNPAIRALAASPSDPSVILAGSISGILYQSRDAGESWSRSGPLPMDDSGYPPLLKSLAFDPSNPSIAYAAGDGYYGYGGGFFKTVDAGAHWIDLELDTSGALSVVVDPRAPSTIYLSTREGLKKSLDGGTTWTSLNGPKGPMVIDPTSSDTIYVASSSRVFQSVDGGLSWVAVGQEAIGGATSLAISPDGKHLYAGTPSGVFDYALTEDTNAPCTPSADSLCFFGGRFRVTVLVTDTRRDRTSTGFAVAQDDRFGYFSLPEFTGDAALPEIFIKMVDGSWLPNGSFWVFYNGLTSLSYTIVVTDTSTGARRVYQNDGACGGADTKAFPAAHPTEARVDALPTATTLAASGTDLLLLDERFRITLSATNLRNGRVTTGSAIAQGDRFGYFSLPDFTGDPNLPEVCVKMVDATSFDGHFWVFYTSLTSLSYTLTVTDSATGAVQTYQNGTEFYSLCGGADTRAFPE